MVSLLCWSVAPRVATHRKEVTFLEGSYLTHSLLGVLLPSMRTGLHDQHCDPYAVPALWPSMSILVSECLSHLQHAGGNELLQLGADVRVLVRVRVRVRVRVG